MCLGMFTEMPSCCTFKVCIVDRVQFMMNSFVIHFQKWGCVFLWVFWECMIILVIFLSVGTSDNSLCVAVIS